MWLLKELYWQSSVKISIACVQAVRVADHCCPYYVCWLCTCQVCHCILNTLCCLLFYFVDGFDSILNFIFEDGISLKQFLWLNIINRIRQSFNTSALPFIVLCRCSLGSLWQVAVWKMSTLSTTDITDVGHGKTLVFLVLECEMFTYWIKIWSCQNRFGHFSHTYKYMNVIAFANRISNQVDFISKKNNTSFTLQLISWKVLWTWVTDFIYQLESPWDQLFKSNCNIQSECVISYWEIMFEFI